MILTNLNSIKLARVIPNTFMKVFISNLLY